MCTYFNHICLAAEQTLIWRCAVVKSENWPFNRWPIQSAFSNMNACMMVHLKDIELHQILRKWAIQNKVSTSNGKESMSKMWLFCEEFPNFLHLSNDPSNMHWRWKKIKCSDWPPVIRRPHQFSHSNFIPQTVDWSPEKNVWIKYLHGILSNTHTLCVYRRISKWIWLYNSALCCSNIADEWILIWCTAMTMALNELPLSNGNNTQLLIEPLFDSEFLWSGQI